MTDRPAITQMLSELLEKRLRNRYDMWAAEVEFDKNTPDEIRIDYVGFKLKRVHQTTKPSSVELGRFDCYEIKSCMADFNSGHGLNFIGDQNWLVTTDDAAEKLRGDSKLNRCGVLVPNKAETALIVKYEHDNDPYGGRRRPASEMLWQMVIARNNRVIAYADAPAAAVASHPIFAPAC